MGKTLRRYLLREIGGAFLAGVAVLSSILFLLKVVGLLDAIFARGVPAVLVLRLLGAILPSFLEATLPMALLLGTILAFARLAADGETIAMRAAGLGLRSVLGPMAWFSLLAATATLFLSMTARPWGHLEIARTTFEIARTRAGAALKPRFFNTDFDRMVVWVDRITPATGELEGVLLSDAHGEGTTVFARRGRVGADEESGDLFLHLEDGTSVSARAQGREDDVTSFRSLEVNVALRAGASAAAERSEPATLDWNALQQGLRSADAAKQSEAVLELHRRLSIAFACMLLGLLGTALGFQGRPSGRGAAVAAAISVLVAYQALMTSAVAAARGGSLPPSVAPWLPDAALALLACWVALRSARGLGAWPASRARAAAARTPA